MNRQSLKTIAAYTAPIWLPFALLLQARAIVWLAGAEWSAPEAAVTLALLFGLPIGAVIAAFAASER